MAVANPISSKGCGGSWGKALPGKCVAAKWMMSFSLAPNSAQREILQKLRLNLITANEAHQLNSIIVMTLKSLVKLNAAKAVAIMSMPNQLAPVTYSCCLP